MRWNRIVTHSNQLLCFWLQNIPPELNTHAKLSEHFSRFGLIKSVFVGMTGAGTPQPNVCVCMCPQFISSLAPYFLMQTSVVEFNSDLEAQLACNNPEAVFGNRFIRVCVSLYFFGSCSHVFIRCKGHVCF